MPFGLTKQLEIAAAASILHQLRELGAHLIITPSELLADTSLNLATGAAEIVTGYGTSSTITAAITLDDYPASYVGSPVRGVRGPLPEGRMAAALNGSSQYLTASGAVSAHRTFVTSFSPIAGRTLSYTLVVLFKGGAAGEPLMCRSRTGGAAYGLFTDAFGGQIGDRVDAGLTFADTSDAGAWTLVVAKHSHGQFGGTHIWKNGVELALTGTAGGSTHFCDPGNGTLYIGRDVAGTDFFTGDIALAAFIPSSVTQADIDALEAGRQWFDITHDWLKNEEASGEYGITGDGPDDLVGNPATLQLVLNNSDQNQAQAEGYYTPGHAAAPTHWERGCPIRLTYSHDGVSYTKFRGRVDVIDPDTAPHGPRTCSVEALDWFHEADRGSLSGLGTETDVTMDHGIRRVIDNMTEKPTFVNFDAGIDTFPFAFDDASQANPSPTTEIVRFCQSERGRCYQVGDTAGGGTVRGESRHTRAFEFSAARSIDRDMLECRAPRERNDIITTVRATVRPRKVASSTEILWSLEGAAIQIGPNEPPRVIRGNYRDPNQQVASISGTDLVTPLVPGLDFVVNGLESGLGPDLTSEFEVGFEHGGIGPIFTIKNLGGNEGWILPGQLQVRGKGLYRYTELITEARDASLRVKYGENLAILTLPYQSSPQTAQGMVDQELARRGDEFRLAKEVEFCATGSEYHLLTFLSVEPGTRVEIVNDLGAIDVDYFVQHVAFRDVEGHVWVTWMLAPADRESLFIFDDPVYGVFDGTIGKLAHA